MSIVMGRVASYGLDYVDGGLFTDDFPAKLVGGGENPVMGLLSSPQVSSSVSSSSSSSSIGRNSDDEESDGGRSSEGGDSDENEVDSPYKSAVDMMESLEEVLPIRRGISKFYNGKSKSFTSLAEASSSVKDIVKPENPYSRRRRNLLSHQLWENNHHHRSCNHLGGRGISKKPTINSSKSSSLLAMAAAEMINSGEKSPSRSLQKLPPLHPRNKTSSGKLTPASSGMGGGLCSWRSYSAAELPRCSLTAAGGGSGDLV